MLQDLKEDEVYVLAASEYINDFIDLDIIKVSRNKKDIIDIFNKKFIEVIKDNRYDITNVKDINNIEDIEEDFYTNKKDDIFEVYDRGINSLYIAQIKIVKID